ncbi:MAG: type I 3-dehydroquinate dehydratase [Parcubacteria group bacterium]
MPKINICTVVTGETLAEFRQNLQDIQRVSDFVELRVDYINGFKPEDVAAIKEKTTKRAIFTCRHQDEGGKFTGSEKERLAIIAEAAVAGFDHIDIELSAIDNLDRSRVSEGTKIICSYHDFDKTPNYKELTGIVDQMRAKQVDVIKIVTTAKDDKDVKKLMKLLINKAADERMIVLGMGEEGKITRIIAPLFGSYLTFASAGDSETAPGQIDIEELREIYGQIDKSAQIMANKLPTEHESTQPADRLDEEALEEEYSGPSARTIQREKAKRAPQGQTKGGLAERLKSNRGFVRSRRQPTIKIIDKTKKDG